MKIKVVCSVILVAVVAMAAFFLLPAKPNFITTCEMWGAASPCKVVKWGKPTLGAPGDTIKYAFVDENTTSDCRGGLFPMHVFFRDSERLDWFKQEIRYAMNTWSSVARVDFSPSETACEADLLIGFNIGQYVDDVHRWSKAAALLQPTEESSKEVHRIKSATVAFSISDDIEWGTGMYEGDSQYVYKIGLHELGHVLGLDHVFGRSIMNRDYDVLGDALERVDIEAAQYLYGPRSAAFPSTQ